MPIALMCREMGVKIKIKTDEEPEYYKKLSERWEAIILENAGKGHELAQRMLDLRDNIESEYQ